MFFIFENTHLHIETVGYAALLALLALHHPTNQYNSEE